VHSERVLSARFVGLLCGTEVADVVKLAVETHIRGPPPRSLIERYALEPACVVGVGAAIMLVLRVRTQSKILSTIVEPVSVDVVNLRVSRLQAEHQAVE
jgi:hypothetical protein